MPGPAAYRSVRAPILEERGKTHGDFALNAKYGQMLRELWRASPGFQEMRPEHREALDVIALKLSRILSGQANFRDHWKDLSGYALLAEEACGD